MPDLSRMLISAGNLPVIGLLRTPFRALAKLRKGGLAFWRRRNLYKRWKRHQRFDASGLPTFSGEEIGITVINLPARKDRLTEFAEAMERVGFGDYSVTAGVPGRELFPQLPGDFSGAIGCNLSHAKAVEAHDWNSQPLLMVCEDDLDFLVDGARLREVISEFAQNPRLDVLCLAGRARGAKIQITERLYVATGIVGQACYVLKPQMARRLSTIWREGVGALLEQKLSGKNDLAWHPVQRREAFFAFPVGQLARQRPSFSDIQGRHMPAQDSTG